MKAGSLPPNSWTNNMFRMKSTGNEGPILNTMGLITMNMIPSAHAKLVRFSRNLKRRTKTIATKKAKTSI